MARLLYQGHGSFRIVSSIGTVIYVDPYLGDGYDKKADLVLVTHEHHDHGKLSLLTLNKDAEIFRGAEMTDGVRYSSAEYKDVKVRAVPAYNSNHPRSECAGFIILVDGVKIYAAGDTSQTDFMSSLASEKLDYALLPTDGIYNMDAEEASCCADIIDAGRTVPIHTRPETLFDASVAEAFHCRGKLTLHPGEEIDLKPIV